jgi:hypothetical protein
MRNTADVTGGKFVAVLLLSVSCVSVINPLVAFYDIHGRKERGAIILFCSGYHMRLLLLPASLYYDIIDGWRV